MSPKKDVNVAYSRFQFTMTKIESQRLSELAIKYGTKKAAVIAGLKQLDPRIPPSKFTPPEWCKGMTHRLAYALVVDAQYKNRKELIADWHLKGAHHFTALPNFGVKCLAELTEWIQL